jgi:hypothetical protein
MSRSSEVTYINHEKTVAGYGDTKDLAFNDLLEKLRVHESKLQCTGACASEDEVCRPFLNPPDLVTFRVYWRKSTGQIRWKCLWGPGLLEFQCACGDRCED